VVSVLLINFAMVYLYLQEMSIETSEVCIIRRYVFGECMYSHLSIPVVSDSQISSTPALDK
jgi:hypothetical protein